MTESYSDIPLSPEESLDDQETGEDLDEGYSPPERPWGMLAWGTTADEAASHESLASRLAHEIPSPDGSADGDVSGTDGELTDREAGDLRAGRLLLADLDDSDPRSDFRAMDVGIDGGAASAEEAAVHIVPDGLRPDL
ncbi:MAG TPA: DUF5709 domain-containing protein [Trebonia sp.]|jgi:hypothetical protein